MSEPTAQVSRTIAATPEQIWAALTTPSIMKSYFLGADISSDFQVGSPITFRGQFKGKAYEDKGAIQTSDPQRRLAFTHFSPLAGLPDQPEHYHTVTFDLATQSLRQLNRFLHRASTALQKARRARKVRSAYARGHKLLKTPGFSATAGCRKAVWQAAARRDRPLAMRAASRLHQCRSFQVVGFRGCLYLALASASRKNNTRIGR